MNEKEKKPEEMTLAELETAVKEGDEGAKRVLGDLLNSQEIKEAMESIAEPLRHISKMEEKLKAELQSLADKFQAHQEAFEAFKDDKRMIELARSLTKADLEKVLDEQEAAVVWKQLQAAKSMEAKKAPKSDIDNKYLAILDLLVVGDAVALYELKQPKAPRIYRTKTKAQDDDIITNMPKSYGIPTFPGFEYSMSFYKDDKTIANLMEPLPYNVELRFRNGNIYIDNGGGKLREVSEMELENLVTKERISYIDLPTLMVFYNIILSEFKESKFKKLRDVHTVYIPELLSYMGADPRINKEDIARVKKIVEGYHNIIGVYYTYDTRGNKRRNRYPVLNFEGDSEANNTISFSSPYLNHVINTIHSIAAKRTAKKEILRKKDGTPLLTVNHSYLIDPAINKERNRAAVENVRILVTGIEQAGGKGYHIAASTLVERNVQFAERLQNDQHHKAQLLKRVFTKTWELLRTRTYLQDAYENIKLPDPKDPANIPTAKNLSSLVFEIKHDGKKSK